MRVVFGSDFHIGLRTDDIDRNDEILDIIEDMIDHGIKVHEETKEEVVFVFGGDIFNNNNPNEKLITLFIFVLNRLRETGFKTFIMVGNHDEVSDPERVSCLNFVGELGSAYPNVTLVDDIKCIKMGTFDTGPLYFTFLPHISKALVQRKVNSGKLRRSIPTQTYIDKQAEAIMKMVGSGSQHIVFSHLNVSGAHGGSEENLLRKSTVFLPKVMLNPPVGFVEPDIVQAHIHCLSSDCELLTADRGWIKYNKITTDDICYGMDLSDDGKLKETKVLEVIKSKHKGKMIRSTGYLDYMMTNNHRLLYSSNLKDFKLVPFSEIENVALTIPVAGNIGKLDMPNCSDEYLQLLVWVFSDGHYGKWKGKTNAIRFRFKKERKVKRLKEILKICKIKYTFTIQEDGSFNFNISNKQNEEELSYVFNDLGKNKELPKWFTHISEKQANVVMDEMAVTDGNYVHGNKDWIQFSTTNKKSRDIIQEMCVINGVKCGWWETKSCKGHYGMSLNRGRKTVKTDISNYIEMQYDDDVWCIRNKFGNFIARSNGKVFITGNSKDKIGNVNIIGSQFYCGFGEREDKKYFLDLKLSTKLGGGDHVFNYIETNCLQFKQLEVSMLEDNTPFMDRDDVLDFLDTVDENTVVKLDVTTNIQGSLTDWKGVVERIKKEYKPFHIKPIVPRTVQVRKIRSRRQKLGLPINESVQVYLKRNIRNDKERLIRVYQRSLKYL